MEAFQKESVSANCCSRRVCQCAVIGSTLIELARYEHAPRCGGRLFAGDRYVVRTRLTGNFPGGTVDLRYRFMLRDGLISVLEIAP